MKIQNNYKYSFYKVLSTQLSTMKTILIIMTFYLFTAGIPFAASCQPYEGAGFTFSYATGKGNWENFDAVLQEHRNTFTYFTDNGDLSENKYGLSFGFFVVEDKKFVQAYLGGIKATAWSCGFAPTGYDVCETYVVKSEYLNATFVYFLFNRPWIRLGVSAGPSFNFVRAKSSSAYEPSVKAKEGKFLMIIGGSEVTELEKYFFLGADFSIPIAFGKKFTFGIEPYYTLPFWKVNAMKMRDIMMPNSTPQFEEDVYKGWMSYGGIRFNIGIGGIQL